MKRLFDDPGLSPELRSDLMRSQRAGHEYDVQAKLPRLREALANPQPTATELLEQGFSSSLAGAGGTRVQLLFAAKVIVVAAVAAVIGYVAWPERDGQVEPHVQPTAAAVPVAAPAVQAVAAPDVEDKPLVAVEAPPPAEPASVSAARPPERSSRREIAQLVRIRALLERDPGAAYQLAQRSEQEFPGGVLSEERRALQVEALAKSGRSEAASQKAQDFYRRYPQSPLRDRVEAALRH